MMRFYDGQHQFYCGVDLHTKRMYLCILDSQGNKRLHRNVRAKPDDFLDAIKPFRDDLVVGAECMFTWYWLADLCLAEGIKFLLGHALYMKAIHGGKKKDDKLDSEKIARLIRGGTFPLAGFFGSADERNTFGPMRIAEGRVTQLLVEEDSSRSASYFLDPTGRFVVAAIANHLKVVDVESRQTLFEKQLDDLQVWNSGTGYGGDNAVMVNSTTGCFRWTYRFIDEAAAIEFGIPQRLHVPFAAHVIRASQDGRTVASGYWNGFQPVSYAGCWIKASDEPAARKILGYDSSAQCDVSPDGNYAAFEFNGSSQIFGCLGVIQSLRVEPVGGQVTFSRDSSRLLMANTLWQTSNWSVVRDQFPGIPVQLSPDGTQVASYLAPQAICLSNAETGEVYARLLGQPPVPGT